MNSLNVSKVLALFPSAGLADIEKMLSLYFTKSSLITCGLDTPNAFSIPLLITSNSVSLGPFICSIYSYSISLIFLLHDKPTTIGFT